MIWAKLFIKSKIQFFESKSQLCGCVKTTIKRCLSSQRYNFLKANHNQFLSLGHKFPVVYQVKDTIFWKQITTKMERWLFDAGLFIKSKIQFFESKSQPHPTWRANINCCLSSQRYNFLKANHNNITPHLFASQVVYQVKDTIFWKQITTPWSRLWLMI